MQPLQNLRVNRRLTAWVMLCGLLFSGQLFCVMGANAAPVETSLEHHSSHPCSDDADSAKTANTVCCEEPASFCCGESKSTSSVIEYQAPEPLLLISVLSDWLEPVVQPIRQATNLFTDITLRRSDPPIHLMNCSFLD